MKFRFLPLLLAWLPLALFAQSVPNGVISFGQVWTPAQWNAAFQAKADVSNPAINGTPTGTALGTSIGQIPQLIDFQGGGRPGLLLNSTGSSGGLALGRGSTTGTDGQDLIITRNANYTGGTFGFVNTAFTAVTTNHAGTTAFEWAGLFKMDNFGTQADASQDVALYAQSIKEASGPTWAATIELQDKSVNPVAGSVTTEFDFRANGGDSNSARYILDLFGGLLIGGSGVTPTITDAIRINPSSVANFTNGIDFSGATITGSAFKSPGFSVSGSGVIASSALSTNARSYGVVCDGTTDDFAAFTIAIAAVPVGGSLYIPPSATMCMLSQDLIINKSMTVFASRGSVFLQAKTGNVSNPVLMDISASNVTVEGVGFDGGGASFANVNPLIKDEAAANGTLITKATVQNSRGIGLAFLAVTNSGVTYSNFNNIGMFWQTSLLASDRHQAIVFTNTTGVKNYATGNYFKNIGLDAISATGQTGWSASENRCDLSTVQIAQAYGNWPACIFAQNDTGITVENNISDSAPGNGIDIASGTTGVNITGNYVTGSGGAGISISGVTDFSITGNTAIGNGLNTTSCQRDGIDFLNAVTNGSAIGNVLVSNAQFGIFAFTACSNVSTLTNVYVDSNNVTASNTAGAYGGNISGPSWNQGLSPTNTGNWTFTPASGTPITVNVSGVPGILINEATAANAIVIAAPAAVPAQIILRGNNATGSTGLLINQDAAGAAQFEQNSNSPMNFWTNATTRYTISAAGGLFAVGVTGGDKGLGTFNASLFNNGAALVASATTDTTNGSNISSGTVAAARLPAVAVPLSGTTGSIGGGALTAGACTSGTVAVTSSTTAMAVSVSPVADPGTSITWQGFVSAAGTVTVRVCALVAATPTATAYNVRVLQ